MKYIKTYEMYGDVVNGPPEVFKLRDYLKNIVLSNFSEDYGRYIRIGNNSGEGKIIYSIIFDTLNHYFIYQFDFKDDGMWIKYHIATNYSDVGNINFERDLKELDYLFDSIAINHTEFGWCFDRETFMKEFDNIEMYMNAKNYNL